MAGLAAPGEFKPINGYDGLYSISDTGRVYSHKRRVFLKDNKLKDGYIQVSLTRDREEKKYNIHRLVALTFVDGYRDGLVVNHIDEVKDNNEYQNLEWVTRQYNTEYSRSKTYTITLPCGEIITITNLKKFCRENNLSQGNMCAVLRGERQHHKNYKVRHYGDK